MSEKGFDQDQDVGIVREFLMFLMENKMWWMLPIALILILLIGIVLLGQTGGAVAPFIYPLF